MILFSNRVRFYLCSRPVDMRNGREGLARIIREALEHNTSITIKTHEISREVLTLLLSTAVQTKIIIFLYYIERIFQDEDDTGPEAERGGDR